MDYDDNDFQSQNLQLAGEGSNKFPPVLQPYALPKFDFDDSLHGHLRFDSLVETEVFLGIENNEDNQWIEEFTRGSCGIRFSSGAAESCSISRCNNVWSEAASSESVEMLLKSVGQEELILAQTDPKESDACDELGCVIKHMETSVEQDDNASSKAADVTDLGFTPISGDAPESCAVLDADIVTHASQVEDTSQSNKDDATVDGGSGDVTVTAITVEVMENNSSIGRECKDANQNEGDIVVSASTDDRIEINSAAGLQVDGIAASAQSIITLDDRLSNKDEPDCGNDSAHANQEEQHLYSQETQMVDPNLDVKVHVTSASPLEIPLCSVSAEATEKDVIKTKLDNMDESCSKLKEGSILSEDMNIRDQSNFSKPEVPLMRNKDGTTTETHEIQDSVVSLSGDENPVIQSFAPLSSAEDTEVSKDKIDAESGGTVSGNSSLPLACPSGEFLSESHVQGHAPLTLAANSSEPGEKIVLHGQGDVHECTQDAPIDKKENIEFPFDRSNMDCEVVESCVINKGPSTGSTETELVVSELKSDVAAGNESAPNVTVRSADVVALDRVDGTAVLPGDDITTDAVMEDKNVELPVGFTHADKQDEIVNKVSVEAPLSDLKNCSAPEYEKGTSSDAADLSQSMEDSRSTQFLSVSHSALTGTVREERTPEVEVHSLCDSNAKRDDAVVLVKESDEKASLNLSEPTSGNSGNLQFASGESQEDANKKSQKEDETVMASEDMNNRQTAGYVKDECGSIAAIDRPESGSPTILKTTELSQNGSDNKGADRLPGQTPLISEISGVDARKALSATYNAKQKDPLKDDKSFTFEVTPLRDLPQSDVCANWQPISLQASKQLPVVEESPSVSGSSQLDPKIVQHLAHASPKVPDVAVVHSSAKGNPERKTRRGSGTPTRKESSKKRNPVKETTPLRLERGEKISNISLSPSGISPIGQSSEMQRYGLLDASGVKPFSLVTSTSSLPDVNSSGPPSAAFHQPFTDLQQLQLRAQIFVYGALIQGTAPDEACMMSAFGGPDGGRSNWDFAWRSCIERLHGKKSHLITPETPVQSRSAPDQVVSQGNLQSKAIASPSIWTSSKVTPIVNPMVPPSSPLWNLPTPSGDSLQPSGIPRGPVEYHRPLSPLHPLQTTNVRNYVGHSPSSWIPQSPFGGPWGASHTTTLDATGRFPMHLSVTEFQSTPLKEPSAMHSSGTKHVPMGPVAPNGASASVSTGIAPASDSKKVTASSSLPSTESKPRKRKKTLVSESPAQGSVNTQPIESTPAPAVTANPSTSAIMSSVGFASKDPKGRFMAPLSSAPTDLIKYNQDAEQRATLSETFGKVKEARMLAEDAASLAAAAVSHSQEIWNQLDHQKSSGHFEDTEAKLASAAVAIAAAAAVAKAAAAAANVAANAALQAKLMADEAVLSSGYSHSDGMKNLGQASPASILKGDDGTNNSSSILFAAREAARKNVEAASAASKRAENVDAIVRAAELAAEAVSQAGKIVTLGDPLSLTELVAAGPEGYWKATQVSSGLVSKVMDVSRESRDGDNIKKVPDSSYRQLKQASQDKNEQTTNHCKEPVSTEVSIEENMKSVDGLLDPVVGGAKDAKGKKGRKSSELAKVGDVLESESGSRPYVSAQNEYDKISESLKESDIMEGSHVEVFKDGSGFKAAWFSANVMSLKDGKAYVSYTDLASGEGLEKLNEWVSLKGEGGEAPKIRVARRVTAMPFEGTRKRRRAAMGDYSWSVGDRVDAWIQDSWWEGVITEKNKKDESMLTVHFPVQEETSVVRAWHLRPSLVWKDGEWIEWSSSKSSSSLGGDTPQEKRQKVRIPVEVRGKDKTSKSSDAVEPDKPNEPTLLELSANEKLFNIGKSSKSESKPDSLRMLRTGLQKEGSRVIFGVPKPGKKRKFMEVSKHYVADGSSKANATNESAVKLRKYLMPQGSGSRGWKNTSKTESNEKRGALLKPKVLRSGKTQSVSSRMIQKESAKTTATSAGDGSASADNNIKSKESVDHVENASGKHSLVEFQSVSGSEGSAEGSMFFSSSALSSDNVSSKKISSGNPKGEGASKAKLAPPGGKLGKIEENKVFNGDSAKLTSDVTEPRRSNRRIQPTSRLLEGLQSSLMVTKIPSVSHDKSQRSRSVSRG